MLYFDTAYVVRCYLREPGSDAVRALAASATTLVVSAIARAEFVAALHRKRRDGVVTTAQLRAAVGQFEVDVSTGVWTLVPCGDAILELVRDGIIALSADTPLRSGDVIHLATARFLGLDAIHTNDRHVLGAASAFGLRGIDVIAR
jgi:predicted nucleic acid-binding protein